MELSGDVALETADGFGFGFAFGTSALEVVASCGVVGETRDDDPPQGAVGLTVTGAAESMALLFAAGSVEGCGAAETREGSFVVDAVRVLARGNKQRAGSIGPDAEAFDHLGCGFGDERNEHRVERSDFVVEFENARASVLSASRYALATSVRPAGRNAAAT